MSFRLVMMTIIVRSIKSIGNIRNTKSTITTIVIMTQSTIAKMKWKSRFEHMSYFGGKKDRLALKMMWLIVLPHMADYND